MVIVQVKVKPNARASSLDEIGDGSFVAQIKSPPVDGKANAELIALLAEHFRCSKSAISIKSGGSSRTKRIRIDID